MIEEYRYQFSVIVPVYNAAMFLEETIESVLVQSVGFDNIQLILIDNASTDGSGDLCDSFQKQYPDNIVCVHLQENVGPAGARKTGVSYIEGKYTTFLDSDDKWDKTAFLKAKSFFELNEGLECVACRVKSFGSHNGWHALDYVFYNDRVVNIYDEYDCIQTRVASTFILSEVVKQIEMDTSILRLEDTKYITDIIMRTGQFGVLRSAIYYYRKHENSTMVYYDKTIYYHTTLLEQFHFSLLSLCKKQYKYIPLYIQYLIMYDLQWRLMAELPQEMGPAETEAYRNSMRRILEDIDDHIICEQRNIYKEYKIYCFYLKYGDIFYDQCVFRDGGLRFRNLQILSFGDQSIFSYKTHYVSNDTLQIIGEVNFPFPVDMFSCAFIDDRGNSYPMEFIQNAREKKSFGDICLTIFKTSAQVELSSVHTLRPVLIYRGISHDIPFSAWKFSKLSFDPPESYYVDGSYILSRNKQGVIIEPYSNHLRKQHRRALWIGMVKRNKRKEIICRFVRSVMHRVFRLQNIEIRVNNERIV